MHNLVVAILDLGLGHQVFQHQAVLYLRHAQHRQTVRRVVQADGGDGVCHIVKLGHVFLGVPLVDSIGKELLVNLVGIVDGVEEILQIVKADKPNLVGLLLLRVSEVQKQAAYCDDNSCKGCFFHLTLFL